MKPFMKRIFLTKKELELRYDSKEISRFYVQLLKMKKKRPHINPTALLNKCYPNAKITVQKIIEKHENQIT